jgi:predicted nucleic acid-binding protein
MRPALIDTDILSEFLRGTETVVDNAKKYLENYDSINFSIITYYEMLNGLIYKDARKQLKRFSDFAELNKILPLTLSATRQAAEIYANLRKKGQPIGHTSKRHISLILILPITVKTGYSNLKEFYCRK